MGVAVALEGPRRHHRGGPGLGNDDGEKEPRFEQVRLGTAKPGLPPVDVLLWVGDNINDFPDQTQALRNEPESAFTAFGTRFIVMPNPMYGSWERNERK